jgi:hypothetical protein
LLRGRVGLGGVHEERLAWVAGEVERLEVEREIADKRVMETLHPGAVHPHVVRRPSDPELVAAGGELTDQVGEPPVIGVAAGFGAEDADGDVGDRVPVEEELGRARALRNTNRAELTGRTGSANSSE